MKSQKAFTLIELLLVVAIIGIISIASLPISLDFMMRNDLDSALTVSAQATRRANLLAKSAEGDRAWGMHFENSKAVIYKCPATGGCTYAGRNVAETDYDEVFDISSAISITGTTDYLFTKVYGITTSGTTTLTSSGSAKNLTVSAEGVVNY